MAKTKAKPASFVGHNSGSERIEEDKKYLQKAIGAIVDLEKERTAINAKVADVRAGVEARGIPKKAFAAALAYFKADPIQRQGFDFGYGLTREAIALPIKGWQMDLALDDIKKEREEGSE